MQYFEDTVVHDLYDHDEFISGLSEVINAPRGDEEDADYTKMLHDLTTVCDKYISPLADSHIDPDKRMVLFGQHHHYVHWGVFNELAAFISELIYELEYGLDVLPVRLVGKAHFRTLIPL